ncbi:testis-expressed protein 2-like [Pollicipes pollicipes]|uniref:testis-expressed protein 2-like n=1 Tax=Pollicipes pollicipes TaxID=41117 RepID=UPI0018857C19|nr:testis-expressed protein 2-like [Pollicipes pollicipes]
MTLRTKVNLMKLSKPEKEQAAETSGDKDKSSADKDGEKEPLPSPSSHADGKAESCAVYQCDRNDDLASMDSSSDEEDVDTSGGSDGGSPPSPASPSQPSSKVGKRFMQVVDKVTTSRYFQQAAQNRYVKRYMEEFSNTPLELTVTLKHLQGVLTLNVPRPPNDRLWYGFRGKPDIILAAHPRLGTHDVTLTQVTDWIENKLIGEVHKLMVLPNMDDMIIPLLAGETLDD